MDWDPCDTDVAASARWSEAGHAWSRNGTVAFIFVRTGSKKLTFLRPLATAMNNLGTRGSAVHLVQKQPLTTDDSACLQSISTSVSRHVVQTMDMHASADEAGPSGGRECSGYLAWLMHHWEALPDFMFFMHDAPPAHFGPTSLRNAIDSPSGFINLLQPNAAVLRCFAPTAGSLTASPAPGERSYALRGARPSSYGGMNLIVRTTYELPASLAALLRRTRINPPRCVITPCCAEFRLRRSAALAHRSLADLQLVDAYVRGLGPKVETGPTVVPGGGALGPSRSWPPTPCHAMEHAWHLLFGEGPFLAPLPPRAIKSGKSLRCCLDGQRPGGVAIRRIRDDLGAHPNGGCTINDCRSRPTDLPCYARNSPRSLWAANLMTAHLIRSLVESDSRCARADIGAHNCAGSRLVLGGLATAWNSTLPGNRHARVTDLLPMLTGTGTGSAGPVESSRVLWEGRKAAPGRGDAHPAMDATMHCMLKL